MALSQKVGAFNTGTGTTQIVVSSLGFQPKALLLWTSGHVGSTDAFAGATYHRSFGVVVSTTSRFAMSNSAEDATASARNGKAWRNDACLLSNIDTGGGFPLSDGQLDLVSFDADGFTLVPDDAFPRDTRVIYWALGGADLTNTAIIIGAVPDANGPLGYTGVGFQPDCVLFLSCYATSATTGDGSDGHFMMGAASGPLSTDQWVFSVNGDDAVATTQSIRYGKSGECLALSDISGGTGIGIRASLDSFDADGFTLNFLANDGLTLGQFAALCLRGGQYAAKTGTTQTDTSTPIPVTAGFQAGGGLVVSVCDAEHSAGSPTAHDEFSVGMFTSDSERHSMATGYEDNLATSEAREGLEVDEVYINPDLADGVEGRMDVSSIGATAVNFIMDTADSAGRFFGVLMLGSTAGAATPTLDMWAPRFEPMRRGKTHVVPSGTIGIKAAA